SILRKELGYDDFHENSDRIYRVALNVNSNATQITVGAVGPPLGPAIKTFYPSVQNSVRFRYTPTTILSNDDKSRAFYEEGIYFADSTIFSVFTYPFRYGNPGTALKNKNSIVLTAPMAVKYFGETNPVGEMLIYNNNQPLEVTGVLEEIPDNTHFPFDFLRPFHAFEVPPGYPVTLDDWAWGSFPTYVLLDDANHAERVIENFESFSKQHMSEEEQDRFTYDLQPLEDIYFGSIDHSSARSGNYTYVITLFTASVLLILLAIFNFLNLYSAKSLTFALETGIRKSLGSSKSSLWLRYLSEPVIVALLAATMALLVFPLVGAWVNTYFGYRLTYSSYLWSELVPIALGLGLITGLVAGIYPAFVLTSFKPITVLKGFKVTGKKGLFLRKALLMLQFSITSFLLIGAVIMSSQVNFLQQKDLGFEKEELVILRIPGDQMDGNYRRIKNKLSSNSHVVSTSVSGGRMDGSTGDVPITAEGVEEAQNMQIASVRGDFYQTIGVEMISGREFSDLNPNDSISGIIINEAAAEFFGWAPNEALNKNIQVDNIMEGQVTGVVEDYHYMSLHEEIQPLIIYYPRTQLQDIYVRIRPGDVAETSESLQADWNQVVPDLAFDMEFMDQHLNQLYTTDIQFARLVKIFAGITIVISILGLYGLVSLTARYRVREVSIRKVLGASFSSLILVLSKSFLTLILLANVIVWPFIYLMANNWMSNFAYSISIEWYYFAGVLIVTFIITLITLVYQTGKVALVNPAETLRTE
ncbi:MAG: ABC transporter permease, partial [Fulvivirga sp.]|nr:ABC transporter permease [Fulvivirga sp.]